MAKSKWDDVKEKLILVEAWARDGLTEEQIAKNLGISVQTFYTYKKDHIEFLDALKHGKEVIDVMVENALLKSAMGYTYEEEVVTTKGDIVTITKTEKPNTTALIFWLKNRKAKEWRDKQDLELSGEVNMIKVTPPKFEE